MILLHFCYIIEFAGNYCDNNCEMACLEMLHDMSSRYIKTPT